MKRKEILLKLQEIFRDVFEENDLIINENTSALEIKEWDSLMHISILMAVQGEFKVTFSMNEIIRMKSVGSIVETVSEKMGTEGNR